MLCIWLAQNFNEESDFGRTIWKQRGWGLPLSVCVKEIRREISSRYTWLFSSWPCVSWLHTDTFIRQSPWEGRTGLLQSHCSYSYTTTYHLPFLQHCNHHQSNHHGHHYHKQQCHYHHHTITIFENQNLWPKGFGASYPCINSTFWCRIYIEKSADYRSNANFPKNILPRSAVPGAKR